MSEVRRAWPSEHGAMAAIVHRAQRGEGVALQRGKESPRADESGASHAFLSQEGSPLYFTLHEKTPKNNNQMKYTGRADTCFCYVHKTARLGLRLIFSCHILNFRPRHIRDSCFSLSAPPGLQDTTWNLGGRQRWTSGALSHVPYRLSSEKQTCTL